MPETEPETATETTTDTTTGTTEGTARYLLLLPGPEAEWAALPQEEIDLGMQNHARFWTALQARGHSVVTAGPLEPSARAVSMRNTGRGRVEVTDGPFSETVEQIVGFYLLETGDADDLIEVVRDFAAGGDHVELRRLASD